MSYRRFSVRAVHNGQMARRTIEPESRAAGMLLAGALGDAVGARHEGGGGELSVTEPLVLTDDTQLTLATCEGIADAGAVDPEAIAARFSAWFEAGRITGIGASTLKAVRELSLGGHWALVGRQGERAAGNGAAMRIAPLALFLDATSTVDRRVIRDVCRITHRNDEAYAGALAVLLAMQHGPGCDCVSAVIDHLPDCNVRARLETLQDGRQLSISSVADQFGCGGYVVESVPLAIWAAVVADGHYWPMFQQLCQAGGDTDSNCAIAGQIVGYWGGADVLTEEHSALIPERELLDKTISDLSQLIRKIGR